MSDVKSVRFRQDQVSVLNGNDCPLSAGFSVRNHRNTQKPEKDPCLIRSVLQLETIQAAKKFAA